ncbi:rod shape-determining protein RodA [candidate division KSB1 bacterium]
MIQKRKIGFWHKLDYLLIISIFCLVIIGIVSIYSATYQPDNTTLNENFKRQIIWALIGFMLMLFVSVIPLRYHNSFAYFFYTLSIILLISVFFIGYKGYGSVRWIRFGSFGLQPSEFAKIAVILVLAKYLSSNKVSFNFYKDIFFSILIITIPLALIFKQPDLGTCLVFTAIFIPILYWAGIPVFALFLMITPLVSAIFSIKLLFLLLWLIVLFFILLIMKKNIYVIVLAVLLNLFVGQTTPFLWGKLKPYQQQRLKVFLNPDLDPKNAGYQILQSRTAIGSGGVSGKGFLKGTQTQLRFLPQQHTDFIFSVIAEESGFVGASVVIFLFYIFILKGINIACKAKNKFETLTAIGICSVFVFHVFINLGMTVGLMPITGLPLPFISYGGSAMFTFMIMSGLLLNISMHSK